MKRYLKRLFTISIILFISFYSGEVYAGRIINVGVYEFKPLIFRDSKDVPSGLFIDVLNHIALIEGWQVNYIYGTWDSPPAPSL